jgi:hypothetical protein
MFVLTNKNSYKLVLVWTSFLILLILPFNTIFAMGTTNIAIAQESDQVGNRIECSKRDGC